MRLIHILCFIQFFLFLAGTILHTFFVSYIHIWFQRYFAYMLQHILSSSCTSLLSLPVSVGFGFVLRWRPYFKVEKWHQPTILLFRPPPFPCRPSLPQQTKTRPLLSHTHAQKYTDELIALSPIVSHVFVFISDTLPSIWNKSPCFHQYSSKHLNPALTWTDYPCSTLFFLWWNIIWSKSQKGIKKTFLHFSVWLLGLGCVRTMTGQPV